ncbi:carbohydrate-binding module family 13 protein [Tulasnella calospora MUT 4182]|uniref:Carbohydrate-binding module family 13 protein n=1 Tax=Tulasnella calospora MUT 4182 TaxID=1051891 RepID=A0A0C3Q319_9AGAM|nr:carbohydrate-binding module family 13 protein [Tulasnella calospora MUT 4182]
MTSGPNNPPPPAYETEGLLPDGLYVLTNIMSRTVLDLKGGSSSAGKRCAGYSRNTNDRIDHQLWIVKHDNSNNTYTLKNFRGGTYLDLEGGNTSNGTYANCSSWTGGDHQLWALERVSRTTQEIKAVLASWKSGLLDRLFQPYGDDADYFVLPYELRKSIWEGTALQRQNVRKHVFDYDNFVIKAKDAVISWGRDRLLVDEFSILFGVVYGNARTGPKAYNWYLSSGMHDLMFFDAQTGQEFTSAAVDAIQFEPTFATF